ncbi:MAG: UvrD-helicase domain-containing protein [Candidatus Hydrothermae bacterium]|nr:UvrD-helicase domain-containing protein [Candidatus Hydrothermae bacterium]
MDNHNIVTSREPFIIVSTSAGSGKTELLARRFVYLLLHYLEKDDDLRMFLAITFSREAAKEMKQRILKVLYDLKSGDSTKYPEFESSFKGEGALVKRAEEIYWRILENYPRLQVRTIDSFMERIRQLVLIELGLKPGVRIERTLDEDVFDVVMEDIISSEDRFKEVLELSRAMAEESSRFEWDILSTFNEKVMSFRNVEDKSLYEIFPILDVLNLEVGAEHTISDELASLFNEILPGKSKFLEAGRDFNDFLELFNKRNQHIEKFVDEVRKNADLRALVEGAFVKSFKSYNEIVDKASRFYRSYYRQDYLKILNKMHLMSISDTSRLVYDYLSNPENFSDRVISLLLRYRHILIDEFQDTDPQQWEILLYFIRELLAAGGTLFIVGDIKQSIYVFRNADYRIMHTLISPQGYTFYDINLPPSISSGTDRNFRSAENIVRFVNETVFEPEKFESFLVSELKGIVSNIEPEDKVDSEAQKIVGKYKNIWIPIRQNPVDKPFKGYVKNYKVSLPKKNASTQDRMDAAIPLIQEIIANVKGRYSYGDIGILTMKNSEVIGLSSYLKETGVPVVSYSSLDIRGQRVLRELIALITCIDSEYDLNSAMVFGTGEIMQKLSGRSAEALAVELFKVLNPDKSFNFMGFVKDVAGVDLGLYREKIREESLSRLIVDLIGDLHLNCEGITHEKGAITRFLNYLYNKETAGGFVSVEVLNALFDKFQESSESQEDELSFPRNAGVDAIRVMTFHKAKGLGFPVVINVFNDKSGLRGWGDTIYYLKRSGKDGRVLSPFKIKGEYLKPLKTGLVKRPGFDQLLEAYIQERIDDLVQDINTIYVGLTRSMEELYNIYFEGGKVASLFDTAGVKLEYGVPRAELRRGAEKPAIVTDVPEFKKRAYKEIVPEKTIVLREENILSQLESGLLGDAVHEFLEKIEYIESISDFDGHRALLETILRKYNIGTHRAKEIIEILKSYFSKIERAEVLAAKPGGVVFREKEILLLDGELVRVDRVRITDDRVEVADFKTGNPTEKDREQMRNYVNILREMYNDKKVTGYLLYVFHDSIEVVGDV